MPITREVKEGRQPQGTEEIVVYTLTTTPWGSTPTSTSAKVFDVTKGKRDDVTSVVMPTGSTSVSGDVITLPALKLLKPGRSYRVEVKFTVSGNALEAFFYVDCDH